MTIEYQLPWHLRKSLNLVSFEVIRVILLDDLNPVVVMRDKRAGSKRRWCVQYCGSGHYYQTLKAANDYMVTRNWIKTS